MAWVKMKGQRQCGLGRGVVATKWVSGSGVGVNSLPVRSSTITPKLDSNCYMGVPEIVDVARNFSVMVRVQGPDPKGLKMRRHAFHHYNSGKTTLSASGVLLPKQNCCDIDTQSLVMTIASVIEPFLSLQQRENISEHAKHELIPGSQIDVMVEGKMGVERITELKEKEDPSWLSAQLLTLVDIPESAVAVQSLIDASSGSSEHGWEVGWSLASYSNSSQPLMGALRTQVQQPSLWTQGQMVGRESSNPSLMGKATTRIAILKVSSVLCEGLPSIRMSPHYKRGDILMAMGSPFGVLSPVHFFNSISVGSIANCYPTGSSKRSLLMADIRCLPGMEGGVVHGENAELIGILARPIRQKTSGAEIQLVIPWEAIATACSEFLQEPQNARKGFRSYTGNLNADRKACLPNNLDLDGSVNYTYEHPSFDSHTVSPLDKAMASVCLVTVDGGVWATGVLLNNQGLILTNAHLLEPWRFSKTAANGENCGTKSDVIFIPSNKSASHGHEIFGGSRRGQDLLPTKLKTAEDTVDDEQRRYKSSSANICHSIRVRLDHTDPWTWCDARVVYVSKGSLDVALLQLEFIPEMLCPMVVDFTCPSQGSKAYVIGHGLFGPRCDFFPSACLGVVAKVVETKRPPAQLSSRGENGPKRMPVMIETTASVHPGGSGGAVVNSDGRMIGLVTSNARHGGGTVLPHLNFSIPCAALEPIFKFSKDMQNFSLLEDLDQPNEHLSAIWALMPPLSPKPGPSLPLVPPVLLGDSNKDVKGSRFAKFISERQELMKRTIILDKEEGVSTKVIPSKL
ncbi:hypothetical protein RJ639_005711 [Escallonia herrerae]|uniref:Glyoxysomal processing protease, glyoxysomal n=1 Tax=Escallonia herrerae TaxID=1293975 RepID=A0AA89AT48_9ASTE|nr:hypothetical protein RJ639_005711 [Escallonia herrerae]